MRGQRMSLKILVIMLTMVILLPCAGLGANQSNPGEIKAAGAIKKQGITTYMYGTHVLLDDQGKTLYALKSDSIDLDKHIGPKVTVKGSLIKGYPVDSGPDFLNVKSIE